MQMPSTSHLQFSCSCHLSDIDITGCVVHVSTASSYQDPVGGLPFSLIAISLVEGPAQAKVIRPSGGRCRYLSMAWRLNDFQG